LNDEPFVACGSPKSYSDLSDGEHTFRVKAVDRAGNEDTTPASRSWIIDATAPETNIASGPPSLTRSKTASFSFSSDDSNDTFECSLDGEPFAPCASPKDYSALPDGRHTFRVRATDAAGNVDSTPARRIWTVDTVAPRGGIKINNGAATTRSLNVRLTLTASDSVSGVSQMCVSNTTRCSTWQPFAKSKAWKLAGNKAGTKTVYVKFKDRAGNVSVLYRDAIRYAPRR
jgi:hypothetical protein